jgi:hypothetical protein
VKFLTLVKPGPLPPPVDVMRASRKWLDAKLADGTFECVYGFVEGGGFSVGDRPSLEAQMELMLDYPLAPFVEYDVRPLMDLHAAIDRFTAAAERMAASMSPPGD